MLRYWWFDFQLKNELKAFGALYIFWHGQNSIGVSGKIQDEGQGQGKRCALQAPVSAGVLR